MEQLKMKIGPKGQVVIPGMFRKRFHLFPGTEVIFEQKDDALFINKPLKNIENIARKIAFAGKSLVRYDPHQAHDEELKERLG